MSTHWSLQPHADVGAHVPSKFPYSLDNRGKIGYGVCRWTNGRFKSTVHRVVTDGSADRYSIPFFFEPNFDTRVECLPSCCSPDNPPR